MIRYLDKKSELPLLPELFDLMFENMNAIAPEETPYEVQKREWLKCIEDALTKDPRQIQLIYEDGALAGFCMYYINKGILMIEELQLCPAYHRTTILLPLYRHFRQQVEKIDYVECFAHQTNSHSRSLITKWGLEVVGQTPDGRILHFRGTADRVFRK